MASEPEKVEDFDNLDGDDKLGKELEGSGATGAEADGIDGTVPLVEGAEDAEELDDLEPVDEAPEMMFSKEAQDQQEQEVLVKYCIFCREIIPAEAIACKSCGHVVHIFEGKVFKQLYFFFWGGIIAFLGSFLPFFAGVGEPLVTTCTTFAGSMYMVFAILCFVGMGMSIYSKRLVMGPVFLMFIPAIHSWWIVVERVAAAEGMDWYSFLYDIKAINHLAGDVGTGLMLTFIGSTLVVVTFIVSLFSAVAGGGKDSAAPKSSARGRGRRR